MIISLVQRKYAGVRCHRLDWLVVLIRAHPSTSDAPRLEKQMTWRPYRSYYFLGILLRHVLLFGIVRRVVPLDCFPFLLLGLQLFQLRLLRILLVERFDLPISRVVGRLLGRVGINDRATEALIGEMTFADVKEVLKILLSARTFSPVQDQDTIKITRTMGVDSWFVLCGHR